VVDYDWSAPPAVVAVSVLALVLFAQAFVRLRRRGRTDHAGSGRAALFALAVGLALAVVVTPLDAVADDYLLSAHMLQHVVIGDLAPALALLALRGPLTFFLLPAPVLSLLAGLRPLRAFLHWLTGPWVAFPLWIASTWTWHVPKIYDYAAEHAVVHDFEHVSFVLVGTLAWNLLIDPARGRRLPVAGRVGLAVGLFVAADPVMAALFSGGAVYPHYADQPVRLLDLSPHGDQVAAGAVMLVEQAATLGTCVAVLLWPALKRGRLRDESVRL